MQTENPLQNAYIGEYTGRQYSYTFKGKTAVEIGNEWTAQVGTIAVNADGVTGTSSSDVLITRPINLSNAKRIIIASTVVGQYRTDGSGKNDTAGNFGLNKGTSWGTDEVVYNVYGNTYKGMYVIYYSGTAYEGNVVGSASGNTYYVTLTIDLEQKTAVGSVSGFDNSTLTLTDAQVSNIRTFEHLKCYVSADRSTISDISYRIEE